MNLELIPKIKQNKKEIERLLGEVEIDTIIKKIKGQKLKQTERNYLSRSVRPKLRCAKLITELDILSPIEQRKKPNMDIILFNLDRYGYELIIPHKIKKQPALGAEELFIKILIQFPEPRFIEAIPIMIIKNKIDTYNLFYLAKQYGVINQIGYLLETSFAIAKKFGIINKINYLKPLLNELEENKEKKQEILGTGTTDKGYIKFLEKTSPKRIKKWELLGRYFDKDFIELAKIYLK